MLKEERRGEPRSFANFAALPRVMMFTDSLLDSHARPQEARQPTGGPLSTHAAALEPTREQISREQAIQCARLGEDNKAKDILILDLRGITPIFDFFVLMTGASRRQLHTLAEEVDDYMTGEGEKRRSIQGYQASRWIVQDYGDIVVHVFDQESREYYALEELWADAAHIDWKRE
jgi:ribosome-associated protein